MIYELVAAGRTSKEREFCYLEFNSIIGSQCSYRSSALEPRFKSVLFEDMPYNTALA